MMSERSISWLLAASVLFTSCEDSSEPSADSPSSPQTAAPDWPIYRGNAALQGVAEGSIGDKIELAWSYKTGGAIISSATVVAGTVYFGSIDQFVYAVDLATGAKRWSFETDDAVEAPPLVFDGRVYIGSSDYFFYVLDANSGALLWKFETNDKILGGANIVHLDDGTARIVVGSYDTNLYCFDPVSGKMLWSYQTDNYVNSTPAVYRDRVIFGGCDAFLHMVSVTTGEVVAKVEMGPEGHVASSVAVADDKVYLGHYGNEFICVDMLTNEILWSYPNKRHPYFSSPSIGEDRIVFGGRDKKLHCVRREDGSPLWTFPTRRKIDGSPVIVGDRVVFGSGDGRLYVVDLEDGKEIWNYEVGRSIYASPAVVGNMILIGSNDGSLYAFRTSN